MLRAVSRLSGVLSRDQVLRNMSWLGLGELIARVSRIATTILLARLLSPADLGVAAIAITCFEIVRAFAASGIGQMVVRAPDDKLAATAATADRANWLVCLALAAIQGLAGVGVALYWDRAELLPLTACLAGVFLLMPLGLMQCYMVLRGGHLGMIARVSTAQLVADNILTAILAIAGMGAWAVVLPKLLTAPLWVLGMRRAAIWQREPGVRPIRMMELWRFAAPVLGSEVLAAARLNLDKVIVGAALGVEVLGIYYFAFNAGVGLSLSLTTALTNAVYPSFAAVAHRPVELLHRLDAAFRRNALPVSMMIGAQAALALVYVPAVFGSRWAGYATVVSALCLSVIAKPAFDVAAQALRAAGIPGHELAAASVFSAVYLTTLWLAIDQGLLPAVLCVAAAATMLQVLLAGWCRWQIRKLVQPAVPIAVGTIPSAAAP